MKQKKFDRTALKKRLSPEQYRVTQERATEAPFSGEYWQTKDPGMYRCVVCGASLFPSDTKFDSATGWPSFFAPAAGSAVAEHQDRAQGMARTEVVCHNCGAHLGHVFDDGPTKTADGKPCTGLRYCINSAALKFDPKSQ